MARERDTEWGEDVWYPLTTWEEQQQQALSDYLGGEPWPDSARHAAAELRRSGASLQRFEVWFPHGGKCLGELSMDAEEVLGYGVGADTNHVRDGDAVVCRIFPPGDDEKIEAEVALPPRRHWWQTK